MGDDTGQHSDYPVSLWGVYQMVEKIDRRTASMEQKQTDVILPTLKEHGEEIKSMKWVNKGLGMLTGAVATALIYWISQGPPT